MVVFAHKLHALIVVVAVFFCLAYFAAVEWRCGQIYITLFNKGGHIAEEECKYQGVDVASIDIGIGHENYLVVTEFVEVDSFAVFGVNSEAYSECLNDVVDLFALKSLVPLLAFDVEDFSSQWQDCLKLA